MTLIAFRFLPDEFCFPLILGIVAEALAHARQVFYHSAVCQVPNCLVEDALKAISELAQSSKAILRPKMARVTGHGCTPL